MLVPPRGSSYDGSANRFGLIFVDYHCGNPAQLQIQSEKIVNLTPKKLKRDIFPLLPERLKSDEKVTQSDFLTLEVTQK